MDSEYVYRLKGPELYLDFEGKRMWYRGQWHSIGLTKKSFDCLEYLAVNINLNLSYEQIYQACWGESDSDPQKAVYNAVSKTNLYFRRFLSAFENAEPGAKDYDCISNLSGFGYQLSGTRLRRSAFEQQYGLADEQTTPLEAEISLDMSRARVFASCGMESTVFGVKPFADGISLAVNFEKTRLRDQIPAYGGAYVLAHPALDVRGAKQICFRACSADASIGTITVELKPKGKAWMHEAFACSITAESREYALELADVACPETLGCLEEITFVLTPGSFANEEALQGNLEISQLRIR